jgi:ribosomal protein L21E
MEEFKVGDRVFHSISNASWNPRKKEKVRIKTVHEGVIVSVKERTCAVEFAKGQKPKNCTKHSLKLKAPA